jgi:hypothetical protein
MLTASIQIGNTDDKLSQKEWASFISEMQMMLNSNGFAIHFTGFSESRAAWQNASWVVSITDTAWASRLRYELGLLARKYRQDSIALLVGETEFVS